MKGEKILEQYKLLNDLLQVSIIKAGTIIKYRIEEKKLSEKEKKKIDGYIAAFKEANSSGTKIDFSSFIKDMDSGAPDEVDMYYLDRFYVGMDRIQPLMRDPRIEDISCESAGSPVYVFLKEYGYIPTNISFESEDTLNTFIRKLVQSGGKQISVSTPIVETSLPDGSRLQASLGRYVTTRGPSFTIRKFREVPLSPIDLMNLDTVDSGVLAFLWTIVEYGANIMIVGGTATGKTTFLNSILSFVSPQKKIVTIEDTNELNLKHENWISTVTRSSVGVSKGYAHGTAIDMFDLLESALRHRPNYIILGEVRGGETFTVFQAMSAGRFGMGTFHADNVETFVHRLEAEPISIPRTLLTSLDVVIILSTGYNQGKLQRFVKEVSEIVEIDPGTGELITNKIFKRNNYGEYESSEYSYTFKTISARDGVPYEQLEMETTRRRKVISRMKEAGISNFEKARYVISLYNQSPEKAMELLNIQ
ncbi:MAG: type II/IV secretion system ATPase subunit [Candidatus Thermoplasmatota archaeon]|nr:type II/IV secretion system ATPase subunit [Candidatus Thermoplasmatota archaeon]MCL6090235.1 type II/IV secretion system ATPase subunit [Candidatus Thermoplasmatota archaeon]MDA8143180.1 type II/IV secretion system ATPase subunit [Thermoplasmatales archaeon]